MNYLDNVPYVRRYPKDDIHHFASLDLLYTTNAESSSSGIAPLPVYDLTGIPDCVLTFSWLLSRGKDKKWDEVIPKQNFRDCSRAGSTQPLLIYVGLNHFNTRGEP